MNARCAEELQANFTHFQSVLSEGEEGFSEEDGSGNSCVIGSEIYLDVNYLHYLYDARLNIRSCMRACQVWSAPYDGEDPPPEKFQPGVLEEGGLKSRQALVGPKRLAQQLPQRPQPCPPQNPEPPAAGLLELEWDDSYDACPVQDAQVSDESKPAQLPPVEPPVHIQEMRRTAIMLVKGSYIEESEFQDDVMVYDLVAKKDTRDSERGKHKPNVLRSEETQPGSPDVSLKNGLSLTPPSATTGENGKNSSDTKAKGQTDCNSNLQNAGPAESGDDLLAQYEELIRTLDTEAGGRALKTDGEVRKPVASMDEEEEMDFSSFSADTPEPEKLLSPFGTKLRSGSRSHSVPFTGKWSEIAPIDGLSLDKCQFFSLKKLRLVHYFQRN